MQLQWMTLTSSSEWASHSRSRLTTERRRNGAFLCSVLTINYFQSILVQTYLVLVVWTVQAC